jgi:steroid delta-isomerase-like uncharacterized protein
MAIDGKAIVRRWFEEVWNQKRDGTIDELMAPQAVFHGLGADPVHGPDNFKLFRAAFLDALPDIRVRVEDVIAEGNLVAVRYSVTGTHLGDGLGVPATNKPVKITGMGFARHDDHGAIVEAWNNFDELSLFKQVNAVTPD